MKVLGIIAEFNPLHNGHKYFIDQVRRAHGFDGVICVMSGNFVQRGEPALCDKWARAEMALKAGVDLVFELPFGFAVRSAYHFAHGATRLLDRCAVVTHLAFGSESGNITELMKIATLLHREPAHFKSALKQNLERGLSFPSARSQALEKVMGYTGINHTLLGPNNILALEYLRALTEIGSRIMPLTVKRLGSGYHDRITGSMSSAAAIRQALQNGRSPEELGYTLPPATIEILSGSLQAGHMPIQTQPLESALLFKLRMTSADELRNICEISEGLENRIKEAASNCGGLDELRFFIKSKRYSLTRINRTLLYILLGFSQLESAEFDRVGPQYLRLLGFSAAGRKILAEIKKQSALKILSRGSQVKAASEDLTQPALSAMLKYDLLASDLYSLLYFSPEKRKAALDFTQSPLIVD